MPGGAEAKDWILYTDLFEDVMAIKHPGQSTVWSVIASIHRDWRTQKKPLDFRKSFTIKTSKHTKKVIAITVKLGLKQLHYDQEIMLTDDGFETLQVKGSIFALFEESCSSSMLTKSRVG